MRITTGRESASIFGMPIDALPNDLDALRALVSQLTSERDVAIAESRRLTEQNDQLRHLLKQLQRAQFGQRSERRKSKLADRVGHRPERAHGRGANNDVDDRKEDLRDRIHAIGRLVAERSQPGAGKTGEEEICLKLCRFAKDEVGVLAGLQVKVYIHSYG